MARRDCQRHTAALVEYAETRVTGPSIRAALDHAARCRACENDLAEATLLVARLRRLGALGRRVDPPQGGWARLRRRLSTPERRRAAPSVSPLAGIALVPALVAALLAPAIGATIAGPARELSLDAAPSAAVPARQGVRPVVPARAGALGFARSVDAPVGRPPQVVPIVTVPDVTVAPDEPGIPDVPAGARAITRT